MGNFLAHSRIVGNSVSGKDYYGIEIETREWKMVIAFPIISMPTARVFVIRPLLMSEYLLGPLNL